MAHYCDPLWQDLFAVNALTSFDAIWSWRGEWFEMPNFSRGGWSGVCEMTLQTEKAGLIKCFIKRQENYRTRSVRHPIKGELTLAREFRNIIRYQKQDIPTVKPVYYAQKQDKALSRGILITQKLEQYRPLSEWLQQWETVARAEKQALLQAVSLAIVTLHQARCQHSCLYPKHIFVRRSAADDFDVAFIDLEKSRWWPLSTRAKLFDLEQLRARARQVALSDCLRFLLNYFKKDRMDDEIKAFWQQLTARQIRRRGIL